MLKLYACCGALGLVFYLTYDNDGHEVGTRIAELRIHEVPHDFVPLLIGQYLHTCNGSAQVSALMLITVEGNRGAAASPVNTSAAYTPGTQATGSAQNCRNPGSHTVDPPGLPCRPALNLLDKGNPAVGQTSSFLIMLGHAARRDSADVATGCAAPCPCD